ncbi:MULTISPECIES: type II toxin-antitoxin system Phd/YefM family antitoxin [unclassified Methylobacterium]|uniref:type II toxin-antitoxin system Phd/YefM family antitoxin n=1 Tax=unclassified Methylobacterium TaxID=2615210 RepID=UPI0031453F64
MPAAMRISIEAAEGQLPQLIKAAAQGEDVVLSQADRPVARIVPISATPFRIGILPSQALGSGPDWLEPMPEDERSLWEGGL